MQKDARPSRNLASGIDQTMAACILELYRSAIDVGKEWAPGIRNIHAPGLVVIPSDDPFLAAGGAERTAHSCGAEVVRLEGLGHWWPLQAPKRGAAMLSRFWASLG